MADKEKKIVEIIETKQIPLKGFTLIEGFPGLGLSGTIGTKYIIEKMKFEQIGYIKSPLFLPLIRIQEGLPMHPARIYVSPKHKLVIVISEQIINQQLAGVVAKEVVEWVQKKGITRVISTSGIRSEEATKIYAFASDQTSKKIVKEFGFKIIENGISEGVTAMLMLELKDNKIEAFCLLGNTKSAADYWAAIEMVKAIKQITGIEIDITALEKEAKLMEQALVKHLKTVEQSAEELAEKGSSSKTQMYA